MPSSSNAALAYLRPAIEPLSPLQSREKDLYDFVESSLQDLQDLYSNCQAQLLQAQSHQLMAQNAAQSCIGSQNFINSQLDSLQQYFQRICNHSAKSQELIAQTLTSQLRIKAEAMQEQANAAVANSSSAQLQAQAAQASANSAQAFAESARQTCEAISEIANDLKSSKQVDGKRLEIAKVQARNLYSSAQNNSAVAESVAGSAQSSAQLARNAAVSIQDKASKSSKMATEAYSQINSDIQS